MYSTVPALVSALFICYGCYVLRSRGASRIGLSFFAVCAATFVWQATWALLFQTADPARAMALARWGYLPILFLPTTLYHFISELVGLRSERPYVYASYGAAALLALLLPGDWLLAGLHHYYFGYYPRAGALHPLHLLQTALVVGRGLYLLYRRQRQAVSTEKARLRYCFTSMLIYVGAATDYLCNYGMAIYPPGVLCLAASLGLMAQAMVRHQLLADPMAAAATIAHEMRTPLATIRAQTRMLARSLPELIAGYQPGPRLAARAALGQAQLDHLSAIAGSIEAEVARSNFIVDMLLASARDGALQRDSFTLHAIGPCLRAALAGYPFAPSERDMVRVTVQQDFRFHGSDVLLMFVVYNLLKNALAAVKAAGRGTVDIECFGGRRGNWLVVTDTGQGIAPDVLPHVFDPYYTTRHAGGGTGMGLAFCLRVVTAFGGTISAQSEVGRYTRLSIMLPPPSPGQAARQHVAEHHPVAQEAP